MIPPDYTALERELGPCALHDHFGSGECPDCEVRRKLADALALAASLQDEIERLKKALERAGEAIHSEYCTRKCNPECEAVTAALAPETGAL